METPFRRCADSSCGRPFQLNRFQFSTEVSVPWKRGEVTCPHCGAASAGEADSVYLTHALSPAQETEFNLQARKNGDTPAGESLTPV